MSFPSHTSVFNFSATFRFLLLCGCAVAGQTVSIDPGQQLQKFEGWGTSLCWWAVSTGAWSEEARNELIGAIVDPDTGLGYTCFRYNIGGGDDPAHTHLSGERAVPGFKPTENGAYDWDADPYQRNILLSLAARNNQCIFEAFSNSPPWWMTISGCASGNTNGADNLKPEYFPAFADYLATVAEHYRNTWGIHFRTVTPFNEPSSGYWKPEGGQEGCGFKNRQSEMVVELGRKLREKNIFPATSISAADETSLEHTVTSLNVYSDSALFYLSQINSHSYSGWSFRDDVQALAQKLGKNLWQSESGPLSKNDNSDVTMWMSQVIIQDLRLMQPNAWLDWQVCDQHPDWRSIEINNTTQRFVYNKRYYMHAAFSRFIRPGAQFIYSSDTNSVAAIDSATGNLIVVLRNGANRTTDYTLDLSKCNSLGTTAQIHRFALPGSLTRESDLQVSDNRITVSTPAQTVTTCVIPAEDTPVKKTANRLAGTSINITYRAGELSVDFVSGVPYRLHLYNLSGKRVYTTSDRTLQIALPEGLYIAELQESTRIVRTVVVSRR